MDNPNSCSSKSTIYRKCSSFDIIFRISILSLLLLAPHYLWAVGEASTYFCIFVPPNNQSSQRQSMLMITAVESRSGETTTVDVIDDDMDGDDDDSQNGITLSRGQTLIIYLNDGAVNYDFGGKADGDFFRITSDHPVVVAIATNSDWQHDWVPAENKRMARKNFYIYSPRTSFSDRDVNVFAYYDTTEITILDITSEPLTDPGITEIDFNNAQVLIKTTLNEGQDLIHINKLGIDALDPGHTYFIQATKDVTVQYGALYAEFSSARDGGGFVPSKNGYSSGELFYFYIPADLNAGNERELRIVSFDDDNEILLYEWDSGWQLNSTWQLDAFEYADKTGAPALCKLVCTTGKKVSVFESNWLETGATGTSDIASFISSESGYGAGKKFVCYMPPPGDQMYSVDPFSGDHFDTRYSHLYIFSHSNGTKANVFDTKTGGDVINYKFMISKDSYADAKISLLEYNSIYNGYGNPNSGPERPYLTIESNNIVSVMVSDWNDNWMTYATSVLLPNPVTNLRSDASQYQIGADILFSFSTQNISDAAYTNAHTIFTLPDGMEYISHTSADGTGEPQITNSGAPDPSTGETILIWSYNSVSSEETFEFIVTARFLTRVRPKSKHLAQKASVRVLGEQRFLNRTGHRLKKTDNLL